MAKKKTKVVKARVRRRRSRKTKRFHDFEIWSWSHGADGVFGMCFQERADTLEAAKQWADRHDLVAPAFVEIDIPPMEY